MNQFEEKLKHCEILTEHFFKKGDFTANIDCDFIFTKIYFRKQQKYNGFVTKIGNSDKVRGVKGGVKYHHFNYPLCHKIIQNEEKTKNISKI